MAFEIVPLDSSKPYTKYKIDIDTIFYTLKFAYNSIRDIWTISIYTEDEEAVVLGLPLLVNRPLITTVFDHIEALFTGDMFVINYANSTVDPDYTGFDEDCDLIYSSEALV